MQRIGPDNNVDNQRTKIISREVEEAKAKLRQREATDDDQSTFEAIPEEMLTESESDMQNIEDKQAQAGRFTPAADRLLSCRVKRERRTTKIAPNGNRQSLKALLEKLIEKYNDLYEVKKHLTLGQSMKYEFTEDGRDIRPKGQSDI